MFVNGKIVDAAHMHGLQSDALWMLSFVGASPIMLGQLGVRVAALRDLQGLSCPDLDGKVERMPVQ